MFGREGMGCIYRTEVKFIIYLLPKFAEPRLTKYRRVEITPHNTSGDSGLTTFVRFDKLCKLSKCNIDSII